METNSGGEYVLPINSGRIVELKVRILYFSSHILPESPACEDY